MFRRQDTNEAKDSRASGSQTQADSGSRSPNPPHSGFARSTHEQAVEKALGTIETELNRTEQNTTKQDITVRNRTGQDTMKQRNQRRSSEKID